jgi:hypothetical protein
MITVSIILLLWGVFSVYKIYKYCKKNNIPFTLLDFDPYDGNILIYIGALVGIGVAVVWALVLCIILLH